jgi:tetratricopeptide (TPR) repeat protein
MSFFRKSVSPDDKPAPAESLKSLEERRSQELRALGEIYYVSARNGSPDARALERKVKELQKIDARIDALRAPRAAPPPPPSPGGASARSKSMTCTKCGARMTAGDRYCLHCGAVGPEPPTAGRPCPSCHRSVDEGARYCNHCGASMASPGRIRIRHPLTGQEASFDFQPAQARAPEGRSYEPAAVELSPAEYHDEMMDIVDDVEAGEKSWIRELERFARPSHGDVAMFVNRGKELLQGGRYRDAAVEFEGAILQNARDARVHYLLGIARYKSGDVDSAIDAFGRCVRLDRSHSDAHNDLGLCHARKGEWRLALDHYELALRANPSHPDAHYNLAHLYIQQMAYPDAIRHLQLYLEFSPRAQDHKRVSEMIGKLEVAIASGSRMGADSVLPPR